MAKNENRQYFWMKCSRCGKVTRRPRIKNKKNTPDKMELNKYCPTCHQVTVFKESKVGK